MNQANGHKTVKLIAENEIAALGASLRQIDQRLLNSAREEGLIRVWYQGGEPYFDLFVELLHGKIQWFQFTLRGKSISWSQQICNWQTGMTNELRSDDITFYPASKFIESDQRIDLEFVELAQKILQTRAGEEIFDKMLALFNH